jgi:hypothetical protein
MSILLFWYGGWGFVIPRIILGAMLIVHGWPKIKDLRQNASNFSGMGFKPGWLWGTIAALLEFFGGVGSCSDSGCRIFAFFHGRVRRDHHLEVDQENAVRRADGNWTRSSLGCSSCSLRSTEDGSYFLWAAAFDF